MEGKERLIVALDVPEKDKALALVEGLSSYVGMFKVGMELFYSLGQEIVREIKLREGKIFLDLKMHDIPNTVASASAVLADLGVDMINVHAAGGLEMMKRSLEAVKEGSLKKGLVPPKVIAVTILTSLNQEAFNEEIGFGGEIEGKVISWALLAKKAGLDGVVASPLEIESIRKHCGDDFLIVTPGVRLLGSDLGDQKRVMTPLEAVKKGASYVVVGRPILKAIDPKKASQEIAMDLAKI